MVDLSRIPWSSPALGIGNLFNLVNMVNLVSPVSSCLIECLKTPINDPLHTSTHTQSYTHRHDILTTHPPQKRRNKKTSFLRAEEHTRRLLPFPQELLLPYPELRWTLELNRLNEAPFGRAHNAWLGEGLRKKRGTKAADRRKMEEQLMNFVGSRVTGGAGWAPFRRREEDGRRSCSGEEDCPICLVPV